MLLEQAEHQPPYLVKYCLEVRFHYFSRAYYIIYKIPINKGIARPVHLTRPRGPAISNPGE